MTRVCAHCGVTFDPGSGFDDKDPRPHWWHTIACLRAWQKAR